MYFVLKITVVLIVLEYVRLPTNFGNNPSLVVVGSELAALPFVILQMFVKVSIIENTLYVKSGLKNGGNKPGR